MTYEKPDFELLEARLNIPTICEIPECNRPMLTFTHNFDHRKYGKIKDTWHKRMKMSYDYIYLCGYHLNEYMPYFYARVDMICGKGKNNVPWIPRPEVEGKKWSDPIP